VSGGGEGLGYDGTRKIPGRVDAGIYVYSREARYPKPNALGKKPGAPGTALNPALHASNFTPLQARESAPPERYACFARGARRTITPHDF